MKIFRNNQQRSLCGLFVCTILLTFAGCNVPQNAPVPVNSNTNINTAPVNSNTNINTNTNSVKPPEAKQNALSMPVTLPVLDAMFSDEQFAGELKTKLQLTDDQIGKLKQLSGDSVKNLNDADENNSGSTRAASEKATNDIRQILGDDKANQLFDVVREKWQGGMENADQNQSGAKPGAIPTDTRIVVNAPAYRMDLFKEGKLVKTYKIGIGYPEFPLPSGMRKADTIIFNPTWTPPDEPWVKGKVQAGKKVGAGDKLNPLGPIKIPIGLPSLIHGGKSPAKLGGFASHGCVGLTDSQVKDFSLQLALISDTKVTLEDINNYGKNKTETKNVKLGKSVPVELRYETIVVENGVLKIFRDVYEKGTNTEENLGKVLDAYGVSLDSLKPADREKILAGLKQMAIDALGNPVEMNMNSNTNINSNSKNDKNKPANVNTKDGSVTRTIKGKKEVTFQLAELKGKGYPAPVNPVNQ